MHQKYNKGDSLHSNKQHKSSSKSRVAII